MIPEVVFFKQILHKHLDSDHQITKVSRLSGGDINDAYKLETVSKSYFIKTNSPNVGDLFQREEQGINLLQEANVIHVPKVIGSGSNLGTPYLLLEFVEKGSPQHNFWEAFANQLGKLHQVTQEQFGLDHDNYIGRLPQDNSKNTSWTEFFIQNRVEPQLRLAREKGLVDSKLIHNMEQLYTQLASIFPKEPPALIHGDLWSGNFMSDKHGNPCIYDPAVYFGHREMELAFTQLFGGFDREFYEYYQNAYPLSPGFDSRVDIYNLYPLLVHVNLFGPSYLSGIKMTLKRFG